VIEGQIPAAVQIQMRIFDSRTAKWLDVQATDSTGKSTAWRSASFKVEK
jgi:hypothetical protein